MKYEKESRIALELAKIAAQEIAVRYYTGAESWMKENQTPVTEADLASNKVILKGLQKAFPNHGIVSEECDAINGSSEFTWYIDPLDGTKSFIRRTDHFTVLMGLAYQGKPVLGVSYKPLSKEAYLGVVGEGAWRINPDGNRKQIKVSGGIENIVAVLDVSANAIGEQLAELKKLNTDQYISCSGEGFRLLKIAEGTANFRIGSGKESNTWDVCAPMAILEAAGGVYGYKMVDDEVLMTGKGRIKDNVMYASNATLLNYARAMIRPVDPNILARNRI